MIRFACECGQQLQAREENAGKAVLCPACKRRVTVPAAAPPPEAVAPEEPPPAPPRQQERVRPQRPALRDDDEGPGEAEDRPRRRSVASSGKAITSLVLGIVSLCGCSCLTGLPSVVFGLLALRDIGGSAGTLAGKPMAFIGIILGALGTLCWPPGYFFTIKGIKDSAQVAGNRLTSDNNLRQMALALHNYQDVYQGFPSPAVGDPMQPPNQQKPNLSWRVTILPFIEEVSLYRQFKFDEPWDGPNNIKLLGRMPKVYKMPGDDKIPPDHTCYQVFVGPGAAFEKSQRFRLAQFQDGSSNTILVAEAATPVPWTKPDDIPFDPAQPIASQLSKRWKGGCMVAMGDGSTRLIYPEKLSQATLKAAVTRNGGEILGPDW